MTEEMNIESNVFLKQTREEWVDQMLDDFLEVKWESYDQWDLWGKYFKGGEVQSDDITLEVGM